MKAPVPSNEADRLEALRQYKILDTAAEEDFDDLALLASYICDTPMAAISLIDSDRQWFKARVGLPAPETSRDLAFCAYTILQDDLLVIPDALADERFATHPRVISDPGIRFYAGAPLMTPEGFALGSLCVIDREPRELSSDQFEALRALSRQVLTQLELRRSVAAFARTTKQLQALTGAMTAFLQNAEWREVSAQLLRGAVGLTASDYGFTGVAMWNSGVGIVEHSESAEGSEPVLTELRASNFDNLIGRVIASGATVLLNDLSGTPLSSGLPAEHPPLLNFLGLPVRYEKEVIGMIGVANRSGGYSAAEQAGLQSLADKAAVLYNSYRKLKSVQG